MGVMGFTLFMGVYGIHIYRGCIEFRLNLCIETGETLTSLPVSSIAATAQVIPHIIVHARKNLF